MVAKEKVFSKLEKFIYNLRICGNFDMGGIFCELP